VSSCRNQANLEPADHRAQCPSGGKTIRSTFTLKTPGDRSSDQQEHRLIVPATPYQTWGATNDHFLLSIEVFRVITSVQSNTLDWPTQPTFGERRHISSMPARARRLTLDHLRPGRNRSSPATAVSTTPHQPARPATCSGPNESGRLLALSVRLRPKHKRLRRSPYRTTRVAASAPNSPVFNAINFGDGTTLRSMTRDAERQTAGLFPRIRRPSPL